MMISPIVTRLRLCGNSSVTCLLCLISPVAFHHGNYFACFRSDVGFPVPRRPTLDILSINYCNSFSGNFVLVYIIVAFFLRAYGNFCITCIGACGRIYRQGAKSRSFIQRNHRYSVNVFRLDSNSHEGERFGQSTGVIPFAMISNKTILRIHSINKPRSGKF